MNASRSFLNAASPFLAGERFVVAEEGENDVGLRFGQPLVGRAEVGRAEPNGQFIARETEVANDELVRGKPSVEISLEPAVVLHAVGQGVADDRDVIARLDFDHVGSKKCGRGEARCHESE